VGVDSVIDFLESRHEYSVRGRVLPSVTRILVGAGILKAWGEEADLVRGRAVHSACWMWDKGTLLKRSVDPAIEGYLESWQRLRLGLEAIRLVSFERKVASIELGCAGRYDREIVIDGERCILELKTGELQPFAVRLQLAAYAELRRREVARPSKGKNGIYGRIAVRLFPDGALAHMEKFPALDYERDLQGFLSAVNLNRLKERYEHKS
jgi:hypothetical protein